VHYVSDLPHNPSMIFSLVQISVLLRCDNKSLGDCFPKFQGNVLVSSLRINMPKKNFGHIDLQRWDHYVRNQLPSDTSSYPSRTGTATTPI